MTSDTIVVGISIHTAPQVGDAAADLARRLSARLLLVSCDESRLPVHPTDASGRGRTVFLDPDQFDEATLAAGDTDVEREAARLHTQYSIDVDVRVLAGDPAEAITAVAAEVGAGMIVVGGASGSFASGVHAFMNGSVVAHLMSRQATPVLVVPAREDHR